MEPVATWELVLVGATAVALVAAVVTLAALLSARRELRTARTHLATMIDPREDLVTIRLKCLEHQLDAIAPRPLRRRAR